MATDKTQIATVEQLKVTLDKTERSLFVQYSTKTEKAMFDICDQDGRIVQTGVVESPEQHIGLSDQLTFGSQYCLWIVDGGEIIKKQFLFG
jgi:hypothetical protein